MSDLTLPHYSNQNKSGDLPPLSNRGVTDDFCEGFGSGASVQFDWLRYSVGWPEKYLIGGNLRGGFSELSRVAAEAAVMPLEGLKLTGEVLRPPKGYNTRLGLSSGSLRYHTELVKQKIGVEFTGRDLDGLRGLGCDLIEYLRWVKSRHGGNVTRLDLAVDFFGQSDPLDLRRAFLAGELVTRAQTCQAIEGHRRTGKILESGGATVYLGSTNSDRYLRVYDKALELKLPDVKWTRIELELGGRRADAMVAAMVAAPESWSDLARAAVRDFCQAPTVEWFGQALTGPLVELPKVGRRDSDCLRWLLEQVMPSLRAELVKCEREGDWRLYAEVREALAMVENRAVA